MAEPLPAGTPWIRLDARTGWNLAESLTRGLTVDRALALGTPGQRPIPDTEPLGSFGGRRLPRGFAIASDGRLFLADPEARVILTALAQDFAAPRPADAPPEWPFRPLWPARPLPEARIGDLGPPPNPPQDPYALVRPVALALAPSGDLAVADAGRDGKGRLLVVTLPDARLRHVIPLAEPVAVSFDSWGRACVAEAGAGTIRRFDRRWRREADYPHPSVPRLDGLSDLAHEAGPPCGCGRAACACTDPVPAGPDLWFIAKGRLHALTEGGFLWADGVVARPSAGDLPEARLPDDARLRPPALVPLGQGVLGWPDPATPGREPLPLPGLAPDRAGRLPGTRLALIARPRRMVLPRAGAATLLAIDSGREGFAWHRLALRGEVPERTRLLLSTATTDARIEEAQVDDLFATSGAPPLPLEANGPLEMLVQSAGGRFLWVRIEMFGDGARTPRIERIDVFGPRRSSLADLPLPFREDPDTAAFLDRFLSYFDTVFDQVRAAHARVPALFDPAAVPAGPFLDWLAGWFDLAPLPEWPEATRRAMVAQAVAFYRRRGTVAGLRQMLQWHLGLADPFPSVIEHFRVQSPTWVAGSPLAPTAPAHAFTIVLPAAAVPDAPSRERLERVIAAAIPAHTRYDLRLAAAGIGIGRQSTLGVDTLLGTLRPQPLGEARLGADALLPGGPPDLRLPLGTGEPRPC